MPRSSRYLAAARGETAMGGSVLGRRLGHMSIAHRQDWVWLGVAGTLGRAMTTLRVSSRFFEQVVVKRFLT